MEIIYTKEGMRIIHPSGSNQFLTLEDLYSIWDTAKKIEKRTELDAEKIHNYIFEVEKHQ